MPIHNFSHFQAGSNDPSPDALIQLGLVLPIEIHVPQAIAAALTQQGKALPNPAVGMALVDTGATLTAVHTPLLTGLGLNPVGTIMCGTANGQVQQYRYPAFLRFPTHGIECELSAVTGVDLSGQMVATVPPQAIVALIGRDLLRNMLLVWNGTHGVCSLSV